MTAMTADIIVVGGGVAGLTCARALHQEGLRVLVAEGADEIGGRIRTDYRDGFLLDRGFQVLQTAYPEARNGLDFHALNLNAFDPGVIVRKNGRFFTIADPLRAPRYIVNTIFSPIGTLADKFRILKLYFHLQRQPLEFTSFQQEWPTHEYLKNLGFSHDMIHSFFKPFFSGVCLDPEIRASSRVFDYIFRMFATGTASIPEKGMAAIPHQIASDLPAPCIGTRMRVASLVEKGIVLEDGNKLFAKSIVLATEAFETQRLLGEAATVSYFSEYCFYFSADHSPILQNMLILNGDNHGPINNLAIPSQASPSYAPPGKTLIAAIVIGNKDRGGNALLQDVRFQLQEWFGPVVQGWRHLKTYTISHALPSQKPPLSDPVKTAPRLRDNLYACGEYRSIPSIQWALYSGRKTASSILTDWSMNSK